MGQLGNGTYTNGNKGSNFSFELKTLQALEQIAILIEAGGSVPGSQNLQQVTTLGNTTTNDIIIDGGNVLKVVNNAYWQVESNRLRHYQSSSTNQLVLTARELATNRGLYLPDADGTLVASVGGVTADDTGNVPIDIPIVGCYNPIITDGDSSFAFSDVGGHYYKFGNMVQAYVKFIASGTALGTLSSLLVGLPFAVVGSSRPETVIASIVLTSGINQSIVTLGPGYESGGFLFFDLTTSVLPLTDYKAVVQVSYMIDRTLTTCI
jgi:hypothetical protein